ncbi:serine hydrolase domain-containing protein [Nocardiopsis trehalosi]|jgi:CubicO group peptidase (beta-lactamase class C family)|uniref:serine hydrolase domain-containing protein n=1 Tax=Nocardiopsis trehalosi TaxID=109329 RepID=UPI00082C7212|nr:serine hydrolase domain-containing protein [Nocardiopsis trehalosi]
MTDTGLSRRGFGRLAGGAGLGAALAGGTVLGAPAARAAERSWRQGGTSAASLAPFDTTMKTFMQERGIPAAQLAVTYRGRLVCARSYAWTADDTLRPGPTALFRIASLSKPVTATAVLLLAERGALDLDARVVDLIDLTPAAGTADERLPRITVRRLLQHLGGWDRAITPDITYRDAEAARTLGVPLPLSERQVIAFGAGFALDHDPGTTYAYANYGYLLLGAVIEAVTGESYEAFVKREVLAPLGITRMRLGRSLAEQAAPTEVPYFSQYSARTVLDDSGRTVPRPYGSFRLETRDAGGAWLSSAVDLVRFAAAYDAPGLLSADSLAAAFAAPETGVNAGGWYYGMGWMVRPVSGGGRNTWHDGSLDGTSTRMVRTHDGKSWAVLFNQRDDPSGLSYSAIDGLLWTASRQVESWPAHDLYDRYFPA